MGNGSGVINLRLLAGRINQWGQWGSPLHFTFSDRRNGHAGLMACDSIVWKVGTSGKMERETGASPSRQVQPRRQSVVVGGENAAAALVENPGFLHSPSGRGEDMIQGAQGKAAQVKGGVVSV